MKKLSVITSAASQKFSFITQKGDSVEFELRYLPRQQTWFMNITSDKLTLKGVPVQCSPNMLEDYRNVIDWGLKVASTDGQDPFLVSDFVNGRCAMAVIEGVDLFVTKGYLNDQ